MTKKEKNIGQIKVLKNKKIKRKEKKKKKKTLNKEKYEKTKHRPTWLLFWGYISS